MAKNRKSLRTNFNFMAILPLLIAGIIIAIITYSNQRKMIYDEIKTGMEQQVYTIANSYDAMYQGNYEVVSANNLMVLAKGGNYLKNDYIDNLKNDTDLEITVFYDDVRMLTTLMDDEGNRLLGTKMNSVIKKEVIQNNEKNFYTKVKISGETFFAIYLPIHNLNADEAVGAICVLKSAKDVNKLIAKSTIPVIIVITVCVLIAMVFIFMYFIPINKSFHSLNTFLTEVGNGKLKTEMDISVLARHDELGEMADASVKMQKSIRNLVERDALTKLYNRRFCNDRLKSLSTKNEESGVPFAICIGDIDFFKKVNDTYGHDAGDMVLVAVANTLKHFMNGKGFVARWGGEEFLIVFDKNTINEAEAALNELLNEIRAIEVPYGDLIIKVTMSIGASGGFGRDTERAIKNADNRLYYAKEHGRNQVVASDIE